MNAHAATTGVNVAQPDITLILDNEGIIRSATLANAISEESVEGWIGQPWVRTVTGVGEDKIRRMVEDARAAGVSAFRQVTQHFPSGLELPVEYTTVRLSAGGDLMAIGKSLQAVAELQSRLIEAQQAMERDYWKLREVETRYRLLFDASNEAIVLLRASNLRVVEANPAALRALGITPRRSESASARDFLADVAPGERDPLAAMLSRVREQGKAPGMLLHLGPKQEPWLVRASLMTPEPNAVYLLQLSPAGPAPRRLEGGEAVALEELLERIPDGFVVLDGQGLVARANRAFLDLVQIGAGGSVVGERLSRWLGRPGADLTVLLSNVERHGLVRLFSTTLHGELGTDTEVELSAAGAGSADTHRIAVLVRDVGRRLPSAADLGRLGSVLGLLTGQIGKTPLRRLVKETVGVVERHYIEAALELTRGNRTAAAELLGLSRQSLYAKLNRYGLDGHSAPDEPPT